MATTSRARGARKIETVTVDTPHGYSITGQTGKAFNLGEPAASVVSMEVPKDKPKTKNNEDDKTPKTLILIIVLAIMLFAIYKYTE